jgi:hypothetical protein
MGRYAVFANRDGTTFILDLWEKRMQRMRARVFNWSSIVNEYSGPKRLVMLTLTYDYKGTLGKAYEWSSNDIRQFMWKVNASLGKRLIGYAWVAELQANGHPHYHVLLMVTPYTRVPFPDKAGWWVKGMTRYTSKVKTVYYICSYMKKKYQKDFSKYPQGMRLFAVGISDEVSKQVLRYRSLTDFHKWIVENHGWGELKFLSEWKRPDWDRCLYVGSTHTKSFAEYLAGEVKPLE